MPCVSMFSAIRTASRQGQQIGCNKYLGVFKHTHFARMQAKQVGTILFVLYLVGNMAPYQQILNIANAVDPSSKAEFLHSPNQSGWRRRIRQFTESGAQLVLWALVLKLNGIIPYPGSDKAWVILTAILLVSSLAVKLYTEKAFYTADLEDYGVNYLILAWEACIHLSIDVADIAIFVLLLSMTTSKQFGSKWIHIGLLSFYGLMLALQAVRDWVRPKFMGPLEPPPWQRDCPLGFNGTCIPNPDGSGYVKQFTNTAGETITSRDRQLTNEAGETWTDSGRVQEGDACGLCYGHAVPILNWFGIISVPALQNSSGTVSDIMHISEEDGGQDVDNATGFERYNDDQSGIVYDTLPSVKLVYRILLTVAIVMLANQPLW